MIKLIAMKTFTIDDIRNEYRRLDLVTGVDTSEISVALSGRFRRKLGLCRFRRSALGRYIPVEIVIGKQVLGASPEVFYDTIRHEYAHAAVTLLDSRNHGHDAAWKKMCRCVCCRPSGTVKAGSLEGALPKSEPRYIVRCERCGRENKYYRKGKVVDSLIKGRSLYRCSCGGKLSLVKK